MYTTISDSTGFSRSVPKSYPICLSTSIHSINLRLDQRKSELSFSDRGKVCSKDRAAARAHSVQNKWTGRNKLSGFDVFHQSSSFTWNMLLNSFEDRRRRWLIWLEPKKCRGCPGQKSPILTWVLEDGLLLIRLHILRPLLHHLSRQFLSLIMRIALNL